MNLWAPYTTNAGTWYVHRFFYGFFGAPVEALVEQSMPDMVSKDLQRQSFSY